MSKRRTTAKVIIIIVAVIATHSLRDMNKRAYKIKTGRA